MIRWDISFFFSFYHICLFGRCCLLFRSRFTRFRSWFDRLRVVSVQCTIQQFSTRTSHWTENARIRLHTIQQFSRFSRFSLFNVEFSKGQLHSFPFEILSRTLFPSHSLKPTRRIWISTECLVWVWISRRNYFSPNLSKSRWVCSNRPPKIPNNSPTPQNKI